MKVILNRLSLKKVFYKNRINLNQRVMIIFMLFILLPISIVLFFYFTRMETTIEKRVTEGIYHELTQIDLNISDKISTITQISDSIVQNPVFRLYLVDNSHSKNVFKQLDEEKDLREILNSSFINNIENMKVYVDDSKFYSKDDSIFFPISQMKSSKWYMKAILESKKVYWKYDFKNMDSSGIYNANISLVRMIRSRRDFDNIQVILSLGIAKGVINDTISNIHKNYNGQVFILNENNNVIATNNKDILGKNVNNIDALRNKNIETEGIASQDNGGHRAYVINKKITETDWHIITIVNAKDILNKDGEQYSYFSILSMALIMIFFILDTFLVLMMLVRIVNKNINNIIRTIEVEGVDAHLEYIKDKDSIDKLKSGVNNMAITIRNLIHESYQAEVREREAKLRALQSQINPHFLYNTLDNINWMAIKNGNQEISSMITSLAKYFKLSLSKGEDIVSISQEMELSKVYLNIQSTRFVNKFVYEFDVEDEVMSLRIPKLILQPIIENALLHGIQKKRNNSGLIRITAYKENEYVIFIIYDNGAGMDEKTVLELLEENSNKRKSYGMYNVRERIKTYGGPTSTMEIRSVLSEGTEVIIKLKTDD